MKICIIGAGTIGSGIAKRLEQDHTIYLQTRKNAKDLKASLKKSDMIIIAVKPHAIRDLVHEMGKVDKRKIIVSTMTGITIKQLEDFFPGNPIVRIMPNVALKYGQGVLGIAENAHSEKIEPIFQTLGKTFHIPEAKFNALTSLTGSGPAFVLVMIEAMTEAGIALGFSHKQALELVLQMMEGTLSLLQEAQHPAQVKWQIATPGGTTIEGLKKLEEKGLRNAIMETFQVTADKAKRLENS